MFFYHRSSFEAILSYRIAVQFAQVSNLTPSTKIIEETIKDGCWFHTIVYIQMYQLKPSEVLIFVFSFTKQSVLIFKLLMILVFCFTANSFNEMLT